MLVHQTCWKPCPGTEVALTEGVCDIAHTGVARSLPFPPCNIAIFVECLFVRFMNHISRQIILLKVYDQKRYQRTKMQRPVTPHISNSRIFSLSFFFSKEVQQECQREIWSNESSISCKIFFCTRRERKEKMYCCTHSRQDCKRRMLANTYRSAWGGGGGAFHFSLNKMLQFQFKIFQLGFWKLKNIYFPFSGFRFFFSLFCY